MAAGILAVGLIPLAYVQSSGTRSGMASHGLVAASALAVDLMDKVVSIRYFDARLAGTASYVAPPTSLSPANPLRADGTTWTGCTTGACGYTRTWMITNNNPIANAKRVDIRVTWNEYGMPRNFTLSMIKAAGS